MMGKTLILVILFCLVLVSNASCQSGIKVNDRKVDEGQTINLFHSDLEAGKIIFTLTGEQGIEKAEITVDKGRNWHLMKEKRDEFEFSYRPKSDEFITPGFLITREDGAMKTYQPGVRVNYQKKKPEDALQHILELMKTYYEQERKGRFLSLFSSRYSDRIKFEEAIQRDFNNYKNIRLHYRIDRRSFDSRYTGAMWDVYWQRNYDDRSGNSYSSAATLTMRFNKEGAKWRVSGLKNNSVFGSSIISSPDLTVASSGISAPAYPPNPDDDVIAVIRSKGNANAGAFRVKFYLSAPIARTETGYENVSSLNIGAQTSVQHTFSPPIPDVPYTVTVTVE